MFGNLRLSTGKLARACAGRPWLTIAIWVLVVVLSVVAIAKLLSGGLTTEMKFSRPPESQQGLTMLSDRLRGPEKVKEVVIISSDKYTVDDPVFKEQVGLLAADLVPLAPDVIEGGISYYQTGDPSMVSADRHTTIMPLVMAGRVSDATRNIDQVHEVTGAAAQRSGFTVITTGAASSGEDFNKISENDLQIAEFLGIPAAIVILILVFGTLVAAGLPLILAVSPS